MKIKIIDSCFDKNSEWYNIAEFNSRKSAREWIMSGLFSCEGAERDHYVDMLSQLEESENKVLDYSGLNKREIYS